MGRFQLPNGRTTVVDAYVEYVGTYTSSTTCQVELKLFAARVDDGSVASNAKFTATCSSPSSWSSDYNIATGTTAAIFKNKTYLHMCTRSFTVTTDSFGKASVNLYFEVTAESSSSYTTSGTITELDLSDTKPATKCTIYYTACNGTFLEVKRRWNASLNKDENKKIDSGTSIIFNDWFDVTFGVLNGYENINLELDNFRYNDDETVYHDDGTITYRGTMESEGDITITSSATPMQYTLSLLDVVGGAISVIRRSSKHQNASIGYKLENGNPIWHHDELEITFIPDIGYQVLTLTAADKSISSGDIYIVSGPTTVKATTEVRSYNIELVSDIGVTITVNRIDSPLKGADVGEMVSISNGEEQTYTDKIYHADILQINFTYSADRKGIAQVVNEEYFISGDTLDVDGDIRVVVITELSGVVHIYDGTSFNNYVIYIFNGQNWNDQYIPYVFDGTTWNICS